jgi:UDP-glucose 4-epimerase
MTFEMDDKLHEGIVADTFRGKSILITGGAGYLASNLISLLRHAECSITRIDRQDTPWDRVGGVAKVTDLFGDVCDPELWHRVVKGVDFIFHFAAQTSTYVANNNPVVDQSINVVPMLYLLEACRQLETHPTVCFSSTVTIVGIPEHMPVNETFPDHPITIYDLHKQMAEQYLMWYARQGFVEGVILRLANVYGPGPRSSRSDRGILNQMIRRALTSDALTVFGTGDYVRDYVYVEDVARAFISAAKHSNALNGGYFIIGSGRGYTITEAMHLIAQHGAEKTGAPVAVLHVDPPGALSPIERRNFVADSRRFSVVTGWNARYTLAEGIDLTMEAFL